MIVIISIVKVGNRQAFNILQVSASVRRGQFFMHLYCFYITPIAFYER